MSTRFTEELPDLAQHIISISAQVNSQGETEIYGDCLRDMMRAQIAAVHRTGREYSTADAMAVDGLVALARMSSARDPNYAHAVGIANAALVMAHNLMPRPEMAVGEQAPARAPSDDEIRSYIDRKLAGGGMRLQKDGEPDPVNKLDGRWDEPAPEDGILSRMARENRASQSRPAPSPLSGVGPV